MIARSNLHGPGPRAPHRTRLWIVAASVVVLESTFGTPAFAERPTPVWATSSGGLYEADTCSGACTTPGNSMSASELGDTPNILVIVADDQAYCQFGFMAGYCSGNAHRSCQSDFDCGDDGPCTTDATGGTHDPGRGGATLRLNDPACRYRQRPAPAGEKTCKKTVDPDHKGDAGGDRKAFPFGRSEYPCPDTKDQDVHSPVYSTPHIDRLVQDGGVLFTRAYVSGNQCKTSRSSMTFGRHHRHNKWFKNNAAPDHPIAEALPDEYVKLLLGKGEVVGVDDGGFHRGSNSSAPRVGRFSCKDDPALCREAACAIYDDSASPATKCAAGSSQVDAAEFPKIPTYAREDDRPGSVDELFDLLFREDKFADTAAVNVLVNGNGTFGIQRPFFLWFAPKVPHTGGSYGSDLREMFDGHGARQQKHMGRVAQMDLTVGAIINELKATCVCVDSQFDSLWEHTVVLYLADHGFGMYQAKRTSHESNHRAPMIVSHPDNRGGAPDVVDDELVSTVDVYRTILGFAGAGLPPATPEFRYGRNLVPRIEGTSSAQIRKVLYGEFAKPEKHSYGAATGDTRTFYMIPAPGEVGVCETDTVDVPQPCDLNSECASSNCIKKTRRCQSDTVAHPKPCLGDLDCSNTTGDCKAGTTTGRCTNDPTRVCTLGSGNAQCYDGDTLCVEVDPGPPAVNKCKYSRALGTFGELAKPTLGTNPHTDSEPCETDADCIPSGEVLCQPLLLKIQAEGDVDLNKVNIDHAWDLRWDPDQRQDLISLNSDYLGDKDDPDSGTIAERVTVCLRDFWNLQTTGGEPRWVDVGTTDCGAWTEPTTTTSSSTSSTTSTSSSTTSTTI
jgi:Sulfatase